MIKSTDFNYYEADSVYGALFFQLPKVLVCGEQYKHSNSDARLAYMVLRDRLGYSLRNHRVGEEEHVYFIFIDQELESLFNYHNQKVVKLRKGLETTHLLMQKQMGFNPKTKKSGPDRLYPSKLDAETTDVYLHDEYARKGPQTLATSGNVKITLPQETTQTLVTDGNVGVTLPHKSINETGQTLATSRDVKITHNLDKEQVLDTSRYSIGTQKLDFSTTSFSPAEIEQQNHGLVKHANDFLTDEDSGLSVFLGPEAAQSLSLWCRAPQQMRRFIGTILSTKYKVEENHRNIGVYTPLGDKELEPLMTRTLGHYLNALKSNGKHIKNVEDYPYDTMQNLFGVRWNKQAAREYAAKHPKKQDTDNEDFWDPNVFQKWHRSLLNDQTKPRS